MNTTKSILVIDDDASTREIVSLCLQRIGGWQVLSAESCRVGLAIVQTEPLDAILLDVMMPGMDGIEFLQLLRSMPKTLAIPVILLTAHDSILESGLLPLLKVKTVITKPFESRILTTQITNALGWTEPLNE